jgi:hypothetical protein
MVKANNSKKSSKHNNKKTSKHTKTKHHKKHVEEDELIDDNISDADLVNEDDFVDDDERSEEESDGEESGEEESGEEEEEAPRFHLAEKTKDRLKKKINEWLDNDDKIKDMNVKVKKYKDLKKQHEEGIISLLTKLGMEDKKIDVTDDKDKFRGRVYRQKSVTKGAIKEDIIKNALMEAIKDEKKVDQLVKKIDSKRPINERYYLKRTKGNKDD